MQFSYQLLKFYWAVHIYQILVPNTVCTGEGFEVFFFLRKDLATFSGFYKQLDFYKNIKTTFVRDLN
jgi:hypothetical protein